MEPRIRLRDGAFNYGDHEIFHGLNLDIAPGEVLSILGPNNFTSLSQRRPQIKCRHYLVE